MPNRILKESICTSESIDSLTEFQEVFFYRLLVNCDDFGRFDARPKILSSRLFPLRPVAIELIENAIQALVREDMITLYVVDGKTYLQVNAWLNHQQKRACKSKYPAPNCDHVQSDDINCNQMKSEDDSNGYQMISDDIKCPRESRIENTRIENRESESDTREEPLLSDDDAHEFQEEQNQVMTAAENAGFPKNNIVRAELLSLYADHGLDKVLDAINECATHSASSIAYLKAVLNGSGKRRRSQVPAQNFEQRDYSDVPGEMMSDLEKEIEAMRRNEQ